jgi:hypothetical protein
MGMWDGKGRDEVLGRCVSIFLLARYGTLFYEELQQGRAGMSREERERLRQQNTVKEDFSVDRGKRS